MIKEITSSAFGDIEIDTNPGLYMPIGFAGGLHDREIGWVRFGYRDYDPLTGRFTAKDPLGYTAGDLDLRGYCFDDPVNGVDPEGLETENTDSPYDPVRGIEDVTSYPLDPITPWFKGEYNKNRVHEQLDKRKERCEGFYGDNTTCDEYDKAKDKYGYWRGVGDAWLQNDPKEKADDIADELDKKRFGL